MLNRSSARRCLWTKKKDLVVRNRKGKIIKVFPYGSEAWLRYEQVLEILTEAAKKHLEKLLNKKKEREEQVNQILDEPDKKIIRKAEKRKLKRYNLTQTAKILRVPRQTLYYWIKKGWVKPWHDYRKYSVFTVFDIEKIIKWRNTIKLSKEPNVSINFDLFLNSLIYKEIRQKQFSVLQFLTPLARE